MWQFRDRMRTVRYGAVLSLLFLHIIMKAPVWYLIAKASEIMGGTGWHRSYLIDQAIKYLGEWWLFGTTHTAHWSPIAALPADPNNMDITNQFILEGVRGGLLRMGLFIAIIVRCFSQLGQTMHFAKMNLFEDKFLLWCLGASLFSHMITFLSVSYFDQSLHLYLLLLSIISSLTRNEVSFQKI